MASSILPLDSASLGLVEFSVLLGATFSATVSAGLDSSGFGSEPASAAAAGSFGCAVVSVPAGLAAWVSDVDFGAAGVAGGQLLPVLCVSTNSRAASKDGF